MALFPRMYDLFLEPVIGGFRETGVRLARPEPGCRVLDVGCGTGTNLALYADRGCAVTGVDLNPDMLSRARARLGPDADLREADATALPFGNDSFDLATGMFVLHEMDPGDREAVLGEMSRVARRVLIIDHHPRPGGSLRGRFFRAVATGIERIAGGDHYRNYRGFVSGGGVPDLIARAGRGLVASDSAGSGTIGVYLIG